MNYFGKHVLTGSGTGKIKIKPVLMRKGNTKLALYGLGYIRDARLHQMFSVKGNVEWARPEDKPGFSSKSWFNTMLIHQNRVHHSPKNAISERYLPSWLDLVVWGHEHECLVEPTEYGDFMVSQPGSSVVTSLIEGEAKQKQVFILEVKADKNAPDDAPMWRAVPQPLETVRPFKYRQISLIDFARLAKEDGGLGADFTPESGETNTGLGAKGKRAQPSKHEAWITQALERMVRELIAEARAPYERRGEDEVPLPLIRLRVDYGGFSTINAQRFGQKFVGKVANPNDLLQFFKSAARRRREDANDAATAAAAHTTAVEDIIGNPTMQDQARIEQLVAQHLTQGLQLLSEADLSNALDDFVNRDKSALENLIKDRLRETMKFVEENAGHEAEMITSGDAKDVTANVEKSIAEAVQQRLARTGATARAAAGAEAAAADATTPRRAAAQEKEIIEHARRRAAAAGGGGTATATTTSGRSRRPSSPGPRRMRFGIFSTRRRPEGLEPGGAVEPGGAPLAAAGDRARPPRPPRREPPPRLSWSRTGRARKRIRTRGWTRRRFPRRDPRDRRARRRLSAPPRHRARWTSFPSPTWTKTTTTTRSPRADRSAPGVDPRAPPRLFAARAPKPTIIPQTHSTSPRTPTTTTTTRWWRNLATTARRRRRRRRRRRSRWWVVEVRSARRPLKPPRRPRRGRARVAGRRRKLRRGGKSLRRLRLRPVERGRSGRCTFLTRRTRTRGRTMRRSRRRRRAGRPGRGEGNGGRLTEDERRVNCTCDGMMKNEIANRKSHQTAKRDTNVRSYPCCFFSPPPLRSRRGRNPGVERRGGVSIAASPRGGSRAR